MIQDERLNKAFSAFDDYNSRDPHLENADGKPVPRELLYGLRMTQRLNTYYPESSEALQLAARSQHIGRWEIPRETYPMDRKGYLQWRTAEKIHHTKVVEPILKNLGYDDETITQVKDLLMKKGLADNPDTQTLEDVICLVFMEFYLEEFASRHDDDKVVDILRKTLKKMSPKCIEMTDKLKVSDRISGLLLKAVGGN